MKAVITLLVLLLAGVAAVAIVGSRRLDEFERRAARISEQVALLQQQAADEAREREQFSAFASDTSNALLHVRLQLTQLSTDLTLAKAAPPATRNDALAPVELELQAIHRKLVSLQADMDRTAGDLGYIRLRLR